MATIKENIKQYLLNRKTRQITRDKQLVTFGDAKEAVIVFDATIKNCFSSIKEFTKYLDKQLVKTYVIGIVPQKEVPQEMLLWKNFYFITRTELTWLGIPKGEVVDAYSDMKPDMLFVVNFEKSYVMDYLVKLSRARFKIGCYSEQENNLDLMINTGNKECEISYFLEQVIHYIEMLNQAN